MGNRLIVGNDFGVYSTVNFGAPWQNHNAALPTAMFYSGALHPSDPEFIWHSNDGGASWIKDGLDVGLPNVPVFDIQINPTTNRTVIFTYGRSAYALTPGR